MCVQAVVGVAGLLPDDMFLVMFAVLLGSVDILKSSPLQPQQHPHGEHDKYVHSHFKTQGKRLQVTSAGEAQEQASVFSVTERCRLMTKHETIMKIEFICLCM